MLQSLPQQLAQSMVSTQQQQQQQQPVAPQHYNFQQFPNQKQAHQVERHPSAQTAPPNQSIAWGYTTTTDQTSSGSGTPDTTVTP